MNRKIGVQVITFITAFLFIFTALSYTVQPIPPITQETLIVDDRNIFCNIVLRGGIR